MPIKPNRRQTVTDLLKIEWAYPVFVSEADKAPKVAGTTHARSKQEALPADQAMSYIAENDNRPMVVMRECESCEGSDDALLNTRLDNEKTLLLSRWFHMVKMPTHVVDAEHPFRNVFGSAVPHLFVTTADGKHVVNLDGTQSQSKLWESMEEILENSYEEDTGRALKKTFKLLDKLDSLDDNINNIALRLDAALEQKGPKSPQAKSLKKQLDKETAERDEVLEEFVELTELELISKE